jgi:hypothetical protein
MARYYFDIREDNEMGTDLEGVELRDLDAAAREATETIVQMAGDYRVAGGSREISIEVRDSGGRRLLTVALALRLVRDDFQADPSADSR